VPAGNRYVARVLNWPRPPAYVREQDQTSR
jgi:hypothetical protein